MTEAYRKSRDLPAKLDNLMRAGKSESDEADKIRDEMDAPWYAMTPEERESIEALSVELYALWTPEEAAAFLTRS